MILCLSAALVLGVTGCDFFRVIAGRPTSSELEAKREALVAQDIADQQARERERFVRDSIRAAEKHVADSAAAEEFFNAAKVTRLHSRSLPGLNAEDFPYRYCIILAGFSQPGNAEAFSARLKEAGYEPAVLHYKRGVNAVVGICPTNDFGQLQPAYEKVRQEKFCPKDAWIFIKDVAE